MRWYDGPEGDQRVWYDEQEIEIMMAEQLRAARQHLTLAEPVPDLEAFVEGHLKVELDQYADLPNSVLGLTEFVVGEQPRMFINALLTVAADENPARPGARGRWRATIAHEASHVILHRYLFDPAMVSIRQGDVRDPDLAAAAAARQNSDKLHRMECLHRDVDDARTQLDRGARDWREIQANRGMAALLMPASIFARVATIHGGMKSNPVEEMGPAGQNLTAQVAATFDVSRQAAALRLRRFGMIA